MVTKNILKYNFVVSILLLSSCADINVIWYGGIKNYSTPNKCDFKHLEEIIKELYDKYPEMHITNEIQKIRKQTMLSKYEEYRNPEQDSLYKIENGIGYTYADHKTIIDSSYIEPIDTKYIEDFFGLKNIELLKSIDGSINTISGKIKIISSKKNIYYICLAHDTLYTSGLLIKDTSYLSGILVRTVEFVKDNYTPRYYDYTWSEIREAKAEFESEILPKILECIETVKQRHEKDE